MSRSAGQRLDLLSQVLLAILGLAALSAATVLTLSLLTLAPFYRAELIDHCVDLARWIRGHPEIVLAIVPIGFLIAAAVQSTRQLYRQRTATQRLLASLGPTMQPPAAVAALASRLEIDDLLTVRAGPLPTIFCHGLLRPRICMTTGLLDLLDEDELHAALRHERHHARRHDPARLVVARTLLAAISFLPGAETMLERFLFVSEMAADDAAGVEIEQRLALASAILKLARSNRALRVECSGVASLVAVPQRVDALIEPVSARPGVPVGALVKIAVGLSLLTVHAMAPVVLAARPEPPELHHCPSTAAHLVVSSADLATPAISMQQGAAPVPGHGTRTSAPCLPAPRQDSPTRRSDGFRAERTGAVREPGWSDSSRRVGCEGGVAEPEPGPRSERGRRRSADGAVARAWAGRVDSRRRA
jgi:beta-lactamase regulating signal transducer with metallopeptidase domain